VGNLFDTIYMLYRILFLHCRSRRPRGHSHFLPEKWDVQGGIETDN